MPLVTVEVCNVLVAVVREFSVTRVVIVSKFYIYLITNNRIFSEVYVENPKVR